MAKARLQKAPVTLPATLALSFLIGATAFSVDGTAPAFPAVAAAFGVDVSAAQLTVSVFLLGFAIGQIPVGLLADMFGRLPVLYAGMSLFIASALLAASSQSVEMLLATRFFQGLFVASGAVLSRAIARDLTEAAETVRQMSFLAGFMGLAMVTAPVIGSAALWLFGWRAPFAASSLFGGIGLCLGLLYLTESRPGRVTAPVLAALAAGIAAFRRSARSQIAALLAAVTFATLMVFVTLSSDVFIRGLGISEFAYGLVFATASLGYVGGNILMRRRASASPPRRLMRRSAQAFFAASLLLLAAAAFRVDHIGLALAALFLFLAATGTMISLSTAAALEDLGGTAGVGAGLIGTVQLGIGGAFSFGLTFLAIDSWPSLAAALGVMGILTGTMGYLFAVYGPSAR